MAASWAHHQGRFIATLSLWWEDLPAVLNCTASLTGTARPWPARNCLAMSGPDLTKVFNWSGCHTRMHWMGSPNALKICGDPVQVPLNPPTWLQAVLGALLAAAVLPPLEGVGEACLAVLRRHLAAAAAVSQTLLPLPPLGHLAISLGPPPLL